MQPFYFGTSQRPLFGVYHAPQGNAVRSSSVVLCPPFGPEYLHAHRAMRELARRLASAGCHVLRFDYYGCGDSAGDSEEADLEQWIDDVESAVGELKETSGSQSAALVGIRLGAALAVMAASRRRDVEALALCDPVVSGRDYLQDLTTRQVDLLAERPKPAGFALDDPPRELLGYPVTPALREGLCRLDLLSLAEAPAPRALMISGDQAGDGVRLTEHLSRLETQAEYRHLPGSSVWAKEVELDQAVVPVAVLQCVSDWLLRAPHA